MCVVPVTNIVSIYHMLTAHAAHTHTCTPLGGKTIFAHIYTANEYTTHAMWLWKPINDDLICVVIHKQKNVLVKTIYSFVKLSNAIRNYTKTYNTLREIGIC